MKKYLAVMIKEKRVTPNKNNLIPIQLPNFFERTNPWVMLNRLRINSLFDDIAPLKYFVRVIEVCEVGENEIYSSVGKLRVAEEVCDVYIKGGKDKPLIWSTETSVGKNYYVELGQVLTEIFNYHDLHTTDVNEESVAKDLFNRIHRHVKRKFPTYEYYTTETKFDFCKPKQRRIKVINGTE